ncbi:small integral membrane protein 24-like [Hypanus sabinus]|uniref:small integral membrane protein 24-like n=1 Tax=Hypanus sabinus TaxID=79690 RepID=UPI0028C39EED|nr:small integral membrane protein 24-like [Hypanus sabinus]
MAFASRILIVLLLTSAVSAQNATDGNSAVTWQPWLTGFTAVTVFLFIVFASLIIKRTFCARENEEHGINPEKGRRNTGNDDSSSNSSIEERTLAFKGHTNPTMTENTETNF